MSDAHAIPPEWLVPTRAVVHSTFGTGTVGRVSDHKGVPTVWIDFDYGETKALSLQHGLQHLAPRSRWAHRTPPDRTLRCDVCGQRPVVINTDDQMLCEVHRSHFMT